MARVLLTALLSLFALPWGSRPEPNVLYRRPMNGKNWRRGIIEECDPAHSFSTDFVEEGEAYSLEGYIPMSDGKIVALDAGVFVSIGIDLGSKDPADLAKLLNPPQQVDKALISKLTPYLGLKGEAAKKKLAETPLTLTPEEERRLADVVKTAVFEEIAAAYDENKAMDIPVFARLPLVYRTLAMSLFSQQASFMADGNGRRKAIAARDAIISAFLKSDFVSLDESIRVLGREAWFPAARKKEADLFASLATKCEQKMQVLFAVDESTSIGAHKFELAKNLVTEFIEAMPDNQSLFGAFFYNDDPKVAVGYDRLVDKKTAQENVKKHAYRMGGTRTDLAIEKAVQMVEPKREVLNPQIYVVTDGRSEKPVTEAAQKARDKMLVLNAVGVGQNIKEAELREIAFDDEHWLVLQNYDQMKCNARQFVTNLCFQPDIRKNGDEISVEFGPKSNAGFGIRVPKSSNLRVTIKDTEADAVVVYGGKNVETPDDLVSHYFHSGNSGVKEMVFKWNPKDAVVGNGEESEPLSAQNGLHQNVPEFVARVSSRLQNLVHKPDDRLVLGKRTSTPDVNKDYFFAYVNIYSKNAKKMTLAFQMCQDGQPGCVEGTNDRPRTSSKLWYLLPAVILLIGLLFYFLKTARQAAPEDEEYGHI